MNTSLLFLVGYRARTEKLPLEQCTAEPLGLGALRTATVALPDLGSLANSSGARTGRLWRSLLHSAATEGIELSGDPDAHDCGKWSSWIDIGS